MVQRELRLEQRQKPSPYTEDRRTSRIGYLRCSISSCECRLLCVSRLWFFLGLNTDEKFSAATKEEIRKGGVTVAALFFGKVFGERAEKALAVFVGLR